MNKFYYKSLLIFTILLASFNTSNSQCVVCVDAPPLITCGESATLTGDGFLTSIYEDNFNNGIGALWTAVSAGGTTSSNCTGGSSVSTINCAGAGAVPAGDFLWFPGGSAVPRNAVTIPIPVPAGGDIIFEFKMEGQGGSCDGPDLIGEGIMLSENLEVNINFHNDSPLNITLPNHITCLIETTDVALKGQTVLIMIIIIFWKFN